MKMASAPKVLGLLALVALSFAVINWGLQYKMSLYQNSSGAAHSPAKLWVGKMSSAKVFAVEHDQPEHVSKNEGPSPVFRLKPVREFYSAVPWKFQLQAALRAFFFRPPPALA